MPLGDRLDPAKVDGYPSLGSVDGTPIASYLDMLQFNEFSLPINLLIFVIGAVLVWIAGTKLSSYVDVFADRTGMGKAFAGALLLGGATSLPELATTLTASHSGAAELAGANLLGGGVMQMAVLALINALVLRKRALTQFSPNSSLLIGGISLIGLIAMASAAVISGELFSVMGVGFWPIALFAAYVFSLWAIYRYEGNPRWEPSGEIAHPPELARDLKDAHQRKFQGVAISRTTVSVFRSMEKEPSISSTATTRSSVPISPTPGWRMVVNSLAIIHP